MLRIFLGTFQIFPQLNFESSAFYDLTTLVCQYLVMCCIYKRNYVITTVLIPVVFFLAFFCRSLLHVPKLSMIQRDKSISVVLWGELIFLPGTSLHLSSFLDTVPRVLHPMNKVLHVVCPFVLGEKGGYIKHES